MPISSWRCWPWDSAATGWAATWVSRTRSRSSSAGPDRDDRMKLKRFRETPRTARNRLSRTVSSRNRSEDWYVRRIPMRIRSWGGIAVTSSPKKSTRPLVAGKSPVTTLNSVVLPAPLAPITARRSPAATENEMFSIAVSAPKTRVTLSSRSASPGAVPLVAIRRSNRSRGAPRLRRGVPNVGGRGGSFLDPPLWTVRLVARTDLELGRRQAERLVHVVDLPEHFVVEIPLRVLHHFRDERRADRLPVRVELHVANRGLERHLRERVAVLLLAVREVALHDVQTVERRLHVDVVDERDHRGVVLAAERHPRLDRHLAAQLAVLGHEPLHLRIGEGVVLGDHHHLLVALVERGLAEADHPLAAIGVEAEEVRRRIDERRRLRARGAVDEGDVGLGLRVLLDRDALRARKRADHDVDLVLLDQLARRVHRDVGLGVGRRLDDLDLAAGHHAVALAHGELGAAYAVLATGGERALERGQQADLDRRRLRERAGAERGDYQGHG